MADDQEQNRVQQRKGEQRADQSHRGRLQQLNENRSARGRAETTKDRAGFLFLLQVRLDGAGHTDRTEEQ